MMKNAIISVLLLSLLFFSYGCKKTVKVENVAPNKEAAERRVKFAEARRKLADPNFVKHATPQQMKELSKALKRK
jgi:hypothetical protein